MARRPDEGTHDRFLADRRGPSLCSIALYDCVVPVMERPIEVMQLVDFFLLPKHSSDAAASICFFDSRRRCATRDDFGFQAHAKSAGLCSIAAIAAGETAVRGKVFGCQADR